MAHEMHQIRGLMPLLMKQRNGYHWTEEDLKEIRSQLRTLLGLSPYLAMFLMPGGLLILPFFAWWLDRRRQNRAQHRSQHSPAAQNQETHKDMQKDADSEGC